MALALFEDKKKPVDIYAKGSPTVKAQDSMNAVAGKAADIVTTPARKAAEVGSLLRRENCTTKSFPRLHRRQRSQSPTPEDGRIPSCRARD